MKGLNSSARCLWLALVCSAVLSGCAPVQVQVEDKSRPPQTVFPAPPDEPRYVWERMITSSGDVTPVAEQSMVRQALVGDSVTNAEGLSKPYAVAVHRGRVFVTDTVDRLVKVFDYPAQRYYKIGDDPAAPIAKALGIDVDAEGNVYVADQLQKMVIAYNGDGKFLRKIGEGRFDRLTSVTVDRARNRLFVVDLGGVTSERHRIVVFDLRTGAHLFDFGKRGTGDGEFNLPRDIAVGRDGRLYVVDGGNFRIQVFDGEGRFLKRFGEVGKQLGNFARPKEIAIDPQGNVFVVDTAYGNFQLFSPDGELLMFIGQRADQNMPAGYMLPSGIYADEDGRIYMVDQWFKKVDVFRPHALAADKGFLAQRPPPAKPGTSR